MRIFIISMSAALFCISCSRQAAFRDDDTGKVVRVFRAAVFSTGSPHNRAFQDLLTFVRVDRSGDVIMTMHAPHGKDVEIHAGKGALFTDRPGGIGESTSREIGLRVRDSSFHEQTATIEYEAWSADPQQ